jgi:hypothetical protein
MKNLTYDQLIELAPKDRPFQIEVSIPTSEISYVEWAFYDGYELDVRCEAHTNLYWKTKYKGTFTLIDPRYQKPEVLKVGQKVRVMESARECGDYKEWDDNKKDLINTIQTINYIIDDFNGICYGIDCYEYPHYCVMPIPVEEDEIQEIPELGNTLEELNNLVSKAQDIISNYKK